MNMKARIALLTLVLAVLSSHSALACAVCFGDTTGSKIGNAATWGIGIMVVIVFAMLGTLAGFGFYLAHRAKHPGPNYDELLTEEPGEPSSGPTI